MLTQQQRNNRRKRASPKQLAYLREKFQEDPKPDQSARETIGRIIDMTPRSVQIWFQNNRAKTKIQEQRLSSLYPTLSTHIGGNRSRIYVDTDAMQQPSKGLYKYNDYSVSMPILRTELPFEPASLRDPWVRSSTAVIQDDGDNFLDFLGTPEPIDTSWNDRGSFYLQGASVYNSSDGPQFRLKPFTPNIEEEEEGDVDEYLLKEIDEITLFDQPKGGSPVSVVDAADEEDTFIVVPCHCVRTNDMEIRSPVIKYCIELEYSPLLEKLRVYFDPSCFSDNSGQCDIVRVMETDIKKVLDYSDKHLHVKTEGDASFYTIDHNEDLVPLVPDLASEVFVSSEYTFYGRIDMLIQDDTFRYTICVPDRSSFDLGRFMDPENKVLA